MATSSFETAPRQCLRGTWTIAQMRGAFDKVAPKSNWKLPIRAEVSPSAEQINLTLDAVEWFCGGRADVIGCGGKVVIVHPGYYVAVGA